MILGRTSKVSARELINKLTAKKQPVRQVRNAYIRPDRASVAENASNGTLVAQFYVLDGSGTYTWSLTSAGSQNAFTLSSSGALTKTGNLDYSLSTTQTLTIQASNGTQNVTKTFVITIADVAGYPAAPTAPVAKTADPYIHFMGGSQSVGAMIMHMPGTYTGSPTPSVSWIWQRRNTGLSAVWSDIAGTANEGDYTPVSGDIGYEIRSRETASNATNTIVTDSNVVGPVVAASSGNTAMNAPVLTRTSVTGTAPFQWTSSVDNTIATGDQWQLQVARDAAFTTMLQDLIKPISPEEFATGVNSGAVWSSAAMVAPTDTFATPTGQFYIRMRAFRHAEVNGTAITTYSPWSNTIEDNITQSVAAFSTTTGQNKNQYLTLITPQEGYCNTGLGASAGARTVQAKTGKGHVEFTLLSWHPTSTNQGVAFGIVDNNLVLGPATQPVPGSSGTSTWKDGTTGTRNGFCAAFTRTSGSAVIYRDGASATATITGGPLAAGDIVILEFDTETNTCTFSVLRVGSTTPVQLVTRTITSNIPTTWHGYASAKAGRADPMESDYFKVNFGAEPWAVTPTAGYEGW